MATRGWRLRGGTPRALFHLQTLCWLTQAGSYIGHVPSIDYLLDRFGLEFFVVNPLTQGT